MKKNDLGEYLFHQGPNFSSYKFLGCNREHNEAEDCFVFRVWAPNADAVELVSDIYGWSKPQKMKKINSSGIWETKIPFNENFYRANIKDLHKVNSCLKENDLNILHNVYYMFVTKLNTE